MDYYKLGETAGKAWRLMHMGDDKTTRDLACIETKHQMKVPELETHEFYAGWDAGVSAVDDDAVQVLRPGFAEYRIKFFKGVEANGGTIMVEVDAAGSLWIKGENMDRNLYLTFPEDWTPPKF